MHSPDKQIHLAPVSTGESYQRGSGLKHAQLRRVVHLQEQKYRAKLIEKQKFIILQVNVIFSTIRIERTL